jgi:long-chain acyl-CoA synthetase
VSAGLPLSGQRPTGAPPEAASPEEASLEAASLEAASSAAAPPEAAQQEPGALSLAGARGVHSLLEASAERFPDKIAYIQDGERVSYRELNSQANRLAGFLLDQGVAPGDRVAVLLENSLQYVVSYYGALKAGAVAVPLNWELKADSLAGVLAELQPRLLISSRRSEALLREVGPERLQVPLLAIKNPAQAWGSQSVVAWDDLLGAEATGNPGLPVNAAALASIIYTSGSTGKPKGVMLSHGNILANTRSIVQYLELGASDIQMVVLPFFYVMGKSLLNTHVAVGGTVVVNNGFAYPAAVIAQMAAERVTGFSGVPSTYAYLLHRSPLAAFRDRLEVLRYCTQAGGHMSREVKEKLLQTLPLHTRLFIMYGATEAAARLAYVEPERLAGKLDSIGRAIPGVSIRVLDEQGRELPPGEPGELVASGDNIMQGYWKDPQATAKALDANGYHTGDLGYQDQDGYLFVTGRKDDLLKVGGRRIDPQEIEDALMATGLLLEVAVLGVEDELLGKRLVALAVPLDGKTDAGRIQALGLAKLPRHKVPSEVKVVAALPKYASSKIDRGSCLALFRQQSAG